MTKQIAIDATFHFGQDFVFCKLIKKCVGMISINNV